MKHFLRCGSHDEEKALTMAIETISQAGDEQLTHTVVDFLMGETDGVPKVIELTCLLPGMVDIQF